MESAGGSRRLRVGVTGHRTLADEAAAARAVDAVLDELTARSPAGLLAVSSLAEGADRLVARRVLDRPGGGLVAVLPLPIDDYERDFGAAASRLECRILLTHADQVHVVPTQDDDPSREAAYERAGLAVAATCDVLLALWDGGPSRGRGGTAELVAEARRAGHEVRVIEVAR